MKTQLAIVLLISLLACRVGQAQVTFERIVHAEAEPANWLTYSGNLRGHRHSSLDQISTANVSKLRPQWMFQSKDLGKFETSPIVVDGVLYITERPNVATALDGKTGRALWSYRRTLPTDIRACCGAPNRGMAILGETLFMGTLDAHLLAFDMHTGKIRWDVVVDDYKLGHAITAAPLVVKDKVIVGIAGGEYGIRGFVDAYDAETGQRAWRLWTIPGTGEPGNETWSDDSWKTGGAPTWVTGTYDPELNLIYWGTGNPGPDWNGDVRPGDNLYSDSLLAIDADTGKLKWHFQFTPHDVHDWDANEVPVLVDAVLDGKPRKLVVQANRNAFYYVLDRETGQFLAGTPYTRQTWASGFDERGRPIVLPNTEPTAEGNTVMPGIFGGTNWFSPSYSPRTNLFYVQAHEEYAQTFFKTPVRYVPGQTYTGGGASSPRGAEPFGTIKALDPTTGKLKWEFQQFTVSWCGLLSTGGNLLFGGNNDGNFFALDAQTGKSLWQFQTGGQLYASPVSYMVDGKQRVTITSGPTLITFGVD